MKPNPAGMLMIVAAVVFFHTGMANRGQYDEEARRQEKEARLKQQAEKSPAPSVNPAKRAAAGLKQATVDSTAGFLDETAEGGDAPPILRTLEGARKGSERLLDNTVRGAVKVATLGYGEVQEYKVEEPPKGSGEPTKIKIKF